MSEFNWRKLDRESESNKTFIGETNKSTKEVLEIPQDTCSGNFQLKVPSTCLSVCQVPSEQKSTEETQLKWQRNFQVPIQGPHQLMFQIKSSRDPRGFLSNTSSIIPVSPGFGEPSWDSGESSGDNPTKYPYIVSIVNTASVPG